MARSNFVRKAKRFLFSGIGLVVVAGLVFIFRDKIKDQVSKWFPALGEKLNEIGG